MNIDTENLKQQLNSCSRTQDHVTKESITKGKFLNFVWIFFLVNGRGGDRQCDTQCGVNSKGRVESMAR